MEKFELGGSLYQPAAQAQGFRPLQAPDYINLLRENNRRQQEQARAFADQRIRDQDLERQALEYQELLENENVQALANFSETLNDFMINRAEAYVESEEEYGLMKAYTEGIPEEIQQAYVQQKSTDEALEIESFRLAAHAEQNGAPTDVSRALRGMSRHAQRGYIKGVLGQAAANYPAIREQLAQEVRVQVPGRDEPITINEAETAAEYAAVNAAINQRFLSQFTKVNPALLNEVLFPQMKAHDSQQAIAFADKQKQIYQAERKDQFEQDVYDVFKPGGNLGDLQKVLAKYQYDLGGLGAARQEMLGAFKKMLVDEKIDENTYNALTSTDQNKCLLVTLNGSTKPQCFGKLFEKDISFHQLSDGFYESRRKALAKQEGELQMEKKADEQRMRDADKNRVTPLSRAQIAQRRLDWINKYGTDDSDYLNTLEAVEDRSELVSKQYLLNYAARNGGMIPMSIASHHPAALLQDPAIKPLLVNDLAEFEPSEDEFRRARREIGGLATDYFNSGGVRNPGAKQNRFVDNMEQAYRTQYMQRRRAGESAVDAHNNTMADLTKRGTRKPDGGASEFDVERKVTGNATREKVITVVDELKERNYDVNASIPSLQSSIYELEVWIRSGGKGPLPAIFTALAQGGDFKVGGRRLGAYEIAAAQYKAHTGKDLFKPQWKAEVDTFSLDGQEKLNYRTSPSRQYQAALNEDKWEPLMNITLGVESGEAYGLWDAMNEPYGKNPGYDSKVKLGFGLSTISLGEVLDLQKNDVVHAGGGFQFTNHFKTLEETMKLAGLTRDDPFNIENQKKLFKCRYLWRMRRENSLGSLRLEWVGLNNVPDKELQDAVDLIGDPYNQPQHLCPGLY